MVIFGWRDISDTFGVVMQAAQSSVGKTLLSMIILPPTDNSLSTTKLCSRYWPNLSYFATSNAGTDY